MTVEEQFFDIFKRTMHTRRVNGESWGEGLLYEELVEAGLLVQDTLQ